MAISRADPCAITPQFTLSHNPRHLFDRHLQQATVANPVFDTSSARVVSCEQPATGHSVRRPDLGKAGYRAVLLFSY